MSSVAVLEGQLPRMGTAFMVRLTAAARVPALQKRCSVCNVREICLPAGLSGNDAARAEELISTSRHAKRGEALYRTGDAFNSLYAIRSGFFKTTLTARNGREQVTAFHMGGEMMGLDGIGSGSYGTSAVALEDSEVCVMPYSRLQGMTQEVPMLQTQFHKVMSREIVRERGVMSLLGSMCAEERLAAFLLNMSRRFEARGFSGHDFQLRMTRNDIGSYLGLKLETVSRTFSTFRKQGLLGVRQKHVRILDIAGLRAAFERR